MSAGTIRAGLAGGVSATLREFGAEPETVLKQLGLASDSLEDPERALPYPALGRLLLRGAEVTGCTYFGLRAAARGGLGWLGRVGFAVRHAPSVRAGLETLALHFHHCDTGGECVARSDAAEASLAYVIGAPEPEGADHIADLATALAASILRELCGTEWRAQSVTLAHRRPTDGAAFHRFFGCPVRFGAEDNAVVFPARWLDRPIAGADPELQRMLLADLGRADATRTAHFADDVARTVRTLLGTGQCSAAHVAELFGITERTLARRLLREGTNYQALVDEMRRASARRLLDETDIPLAELAGILGYSEASAFTRAFRRWEGTSPTSWRQAAPRRRGGAG